MKLIYLFALPLFAILGAPLPASESHAPATSFNNLLKSTADPKSWQFEETDDAHGTLQSEGDAIAFKVTKLDGTDWHIQAFQPGLALTNGENYVVTFQAKASANRTVQLYVGVNEDDYHAIGLDKIVDLTPEWKTYQFTFKAEAPTPKNNRLGFLVAQQLGTVWIRDLVLSAK